MPFRSRKGAFAPVPASSLAAVVLLSLWTAACGDGTTEPAPAPNRAPLASGSIPALTVTVGETVTVNVAGYFTDPDGDALTFSATSSNAATASVAVSGSVVTVSAVARGVATVTVTATDPDGLSAQQGFEVTVPNQAPVATGTVPAQTVFVGDTAHVDMAAYFNDPDGDALAYSAASSNAGAVSASVAGSVVSISAIAAGTAIITITVTDPDGLSAQHNFEATVPNRAPAPAGALAAQTLAVGQTVAVEVSPYFADPDGDSLSYAAASTDTAVASATVAGGVVTVEAIARGTASVTVTATDPGGLSAHQSFEVTVPNQAPVVRDSIQSGTLGVGETESWSGPDLFRDPDGDSLIYAAGSSDSEVVRPWVTDDVLLVQGLSPGTATVTFRALDPEGASARIVFDVTVLGPVSIRGTDPLVLLEGATATVFGSGFSSSPELNRVSIGGLPTRVTAATGTALSIEVPRADCLPPRRAELRVSVGVRSDARTVGVTPRRREDLALPQGWYRSTHADNGRSRAGPLAREGRDMGKDAAVANSKTATSTLREQHVRRVVDAAQESHSAITRRNYLAAWRRFEAWADRESLGSIPALPETVAAYLAERAANGLSPASLPLDRAAIRHHHTDAGHANPADNEGVRRVLRGLTRPGGARGSHPETGRRAHGGWAGRDPCDCPSAAHGTGRSNRAGQRGPPPR